MKKTCKSGSIQSLLNKQGESAFRSPLLKERQRNNSERERNKSEDIRIGFNLIKQKKNRISVLDEYCRNPIMEEDERNYLTPRLQVNKIQKVIAPTMHNIENLKQQIFASQNNSIDEIQVSLFLLSLCILWIPFIN